MGKISIEEVIKWYEDHYTIYIIEDIYKTYPDNKKYIGDCKNKKCRFCGKDITQTKFSQVAHAIPEFLGNDYLISNEECDECNKYFSETVEDNLAKFLLPLNVIGQIAGKKKYPSYKSKDKSFRIDVTDKFVSVNKFDDKYCNIDRINKKVSINTESQPFIEREVFRCFVKMGLSLLPQEELTNFQETIYWLRYMNCTAKFIPDDAYLIFRTFTSGLYPYGDKPLNAVFKRKDSITDVPYMLYMISVGNLMFQIILPCPKKDKEIGTVELLSFPSPYSLDENKTKCHHFNDVDKLNFCGVEKRTEYYPFNISYQVDEFVE